MFSHFGIFIGTLFILHLSGRTRCKDDSDDQSQDNIRKLVTSLMKSGIHESVMNSTYKIREKLKNALSFVESAIERALNCTNCIDNFLGVNDKSKTKKPKCTGDDCENDFETIGDDVSDLPVLSRIVSIHNLSKEAKPSTKHHKKPKKHHSKNVLPKKENSVPANQSPVVMTTPSSKQMNPMPPQNVPPTEDSYAGSDGQCLSPCSQVCAPQCSYQCCQTNTVPSSQSPNMINPTMANQNICPAGCMSQCHDYCPPQCCRSKIHKPSSNRFASNRMMINHT